MADVVTPNQFELDYLAAAPADLAGLAAAIVDAGECGLQVVFVTSVRTVGRRTFIDLAVSDEPAASAAHAAAADRRRGAGDAIAALFFAHY